MLEFLDALIMCYSFHGNVLPEILQQVCEQVWVVNRIVSLLNRPFTSWLKGYVQ